MGLKTNDGSGSGSNLNFLNAINVTESEPRWALRVDAGTEGAVEREAKCGVVNELYYQVVDGVIKGVRIVDKGEYGEELSILLDDGDDAYVLGVPFSGELGKGFIQRMPNMLATESIDIGLTAMADPRNPGKFKRFLYAKQCDTKVANAYLKDNEAGLHLPEPKKVEGRGGKTEWDWKDHEDALYEVCKEWSVKNGWATAENFGEKPYESKKNDDAAVPATPAAAEGADEYDDDSVPF